MERIALFGGSFDPVHHGHLLVAQAAVEELSLDRLFFVPAAQSPFKPARNPAPAADRLRWLRLALVGHPEYEVDDFEVRRGGVSYTVETLREYRRRYSRTELCYIIGADNVAKLPQWRDAQELAQLASFIIVPRPGEEPPEIPNPFRGKVLKGFFVGISSSEIRDRVRKGLSIDLLTPQPVAEDIRNKNLYLG